MPPVSDWVVDDRPLPGFDPASAWCLAHGRAFVPMLLDRRESPEDFDYVIATDAASPQPGEESAPPPPVLFRVGDLTGDGAAEAALAALATEHGMAEPGFHLLPLRRRMLVPPGEDAGADTGGGVALSPIAQGGVAAPAPGAEPPTALVGVIDHAINVFHERFRVGNTRSRVLFAWDQGGTRQPVRNVPFGRDWSQADLSGLLGGNGGDDAACLRAAGMLDFVRPGDHPLAYRQSHGTGVLDLAAGADPHGAEIEAAPPILAVMLPSVVARESSGMLLPFFLLQAMEYLLAKAREVNAAWGLSGEASIPLYVNASFGVSGCTRGDAHPIQRGIRSLVAWHKAREGGPATVVFPSGNRNLSQGHARGAGRLAVPWRLQPGDRTSNYLDIRIAGSGPVHLGLGAPGGGAPATQPLESGRPLTLMRGAAVIGRAFLEDRPNGTRRLGIATAPTDPCDTGRVPAQAGAWTLAVETPEDPASEIQGWILRDDSPPGFSDGGRQSYFDDPTYRRHDRRGDVLADDDPAADTVSRQGAFNAMSTGGAALVIGGYRLAESERQVPPAAGARRSAVPALYSASPLEDARRLGSPEAVIVSAVSDRSRVSAGVLCAATRSGGTLPLDGTSVAAPQAVRLLAAAVPGDAKAFLENQTLFSAPAALPGRRIGAGGLPAEARVSRR